jgi:hypothetical protein
VFTNLTRNLGIRGLEVVELYDIEPWAVDHLNPKGLIFCFLWHKDTHRMTDFEDPAAGRVWFANQLIDDACASQAILNVVLNCPDVDIGENLRVFRSETENMSAPVRYIIVSPRHIACLIGFLSVLDERACHFQLSIDTSSPQRTRPVCAFLWQRYVHRYLVGNFRDPPMSVAPHMQLRKRHLTLSHQHLLCTLIPRNAGTT